MGGKVLLVDMDPQGNATTSSGAEKTKLSRSIYQVLLEQCSLGEARITAAAGGYDLVPASRDLAGAEVELVNEVGREQRLKRALASVEFQYDYVFIDCPPALNLLTVNGLTAAAAVIIPMQCEYYALEGLSDLVQTIRKVRQHLNPVLEIEGLLRTMFDPRNSLALQVSAQLEQHFGDKVYKTVIPRNIRLAEAPSFGIPVLLHDRSSKGAQAYLALASEVLRRGDATKMAS